MCKNCPCKFHCVAFITVVCIIILMLKETFLFCLCPPPKCIVANVFSIAEEEKFGIL